MKKMKRNLSLVLVLALNLILGFGEGFAQISEDVNVDFPERQQDLTTAQNVVKAYEMGNWETLRKNVTPDVHFYNLGTYDSLTIDQTIEYWKKGRETATPVLSEDGVWLPVQVKSGPREGPWVLHWGSNTLTYPNGETISFPYHVAMKFDGEKISQAYFYYDNNRIIRALGYDIQPPLKEDDAEDGVPHPGGYQD
ncbi:MAG: hypothetical protein WBL27_12325 [Salinimicrobium sp.]